MYQIQLIYFFRDGHLHCRDATTAICANTLVVVDPQATASSDYPDAVLARSYTLGDLHELHRNIIDVLGSSWTTHDFHPDAMRALPVSKELGQAIRHFGQCEKQVLLKFLWLYCLGIDGDYYSRLLTSIIDSNRDFFAFIEEHSLKAWPVSIYAKKMGITLRKLNQLFEQKFGMSAKRWLLEYRLLRARDMLLRTSMTITDVAMGCGFSSHAHFSDTFKKRYQRCPSALRQLAQ